MFKISKEFIFNAILKTLENVVYNGVLFPETFYCDVAMNFLLIFFLNNFPEVFAVADMFRYVYSGIIFYINVQ